MSLSTKRFDYILKSEASGVEHGLMIDWSSESENPFQSVVQEQKPPDASSQSDNEELYTGRDLSDAWRIFFTNFSAGEGQLEREVPDGVSSKYHASNAIDISRPGEIRLAHGLDFVPVDVSDGLTELCLEAEGKLVFVCDESSTSRVAWFDDEGVEHHATGITCMGTPTAIASDGEFVYVAFSSMGDYGIWRGDLSGLSDWVEWWPLSGIEALCYCGGVMYAIQAGVPGYIAAAGTFTPLNVDAIHKPTLTTFGFGAIGNWIYWGVTTGSRSWVHALQHNVVEGDRFEHYVELPTGFVGTTMHGYLGNLYIAGYFVSARGEVGQGVLYVATDNGIARLCTVGDDPNLLPAGDAALDDTYNNRVRVLQGYGAWIYIVTDRALYRWDLDDGGLAHVIDIGAYYSSGGLVLVTIPPEKLGEYESELGVWDTYHTIDSFPVGWDGDPTWGQDTGVTYKRSSADIIDEVTAEGVYSARCDTGDTAGYNRWIRLDSFPTTMPDVLTMRFKTTLLRQEALQFGGYLNGKAVVVRVFGNETDNKFYTRVMIGEAVWGTSVGLDARNGEHVFYMTFDGEKINLWIDDVLTHADVVAPATTKDEKLFWSCGWAEYPASYVKDWRCDIMEIGVKLDAAADPDYIPGSQRIPSMAVISGVPYIPYAVVGGDQGFVSIDLSTYHPSGWLETSWKSAQMPTVEKHFTAIDVFHDALTEGQSLRIDYEIDGQTTSSFTIDAVDGSVAYSYPIDIHGRRIRLRFNSFSPDPYTTTPVCHGACVRWAPVATKVYTMLTLLKDNVRDYDGMDYNYLDAYEFILAAADSGEVLSMRTAGIDIRAKVTGFQFMKAKTSRQHSYEPQGTALVRLERVQ